MGILLVFVFGFLCAYVIVRLLGWLLMLAVWVCLLVITLPSLIWRRQHQPSVVVLPPEPTSYARAVHFDGYEYPDGHRVYLTHAEDRRNHV